MHLSALLFIFITAWSGWSGASGKIGGGWDTAPNTQYHIQTDEGPERYFRYQTLSGQYRKEKRLQDGSVVGTYGSVDADGFLRLRDYVADDKGYRIVRTKTVRVGSEDSTPSPPSSTTPAPPISLSDYLREKEAETTKLRLEGGSLSNQLVPTVGTPSGQPLDASSLQPLGASSLQPLGASSLQPLGASSLQPLGVSTLEPLRTPSVEVVPNGYPAVPSYTTPAPPPLANDYIRPTTFRPQFYNLNALDQKAYETGQYDPYDGVAVTQNGFRYYLPRHYHEEENLPGDRRAGSFGYIDPFGIRRVVYYNTAPGTGFVHRKNNRYVGFGATPYDPRF